MRKCTYNEMWRREEYRQSGNYCKQRENYKAQAINNHRCEFPIARYVARFVLFLQLKVQIKAFILPQITAQVYIILFRDKQVINSINSIERADI